MANRDMKGEAPGGDLSSSNEYIRVVPGNGFKLSKKFDVQAATPGCLVWHHVFGLDSEEAANGVKKFVLWTGANIRERASHRAKCRAF